MEFILVVDDNPDARGVAASCLRDHGMKPLFAENGEEALKVLDESHPDAVLTDLEMPVMDGLELVRRMRTQHPRVPAVLMTSSGGEEHAVAALRAGALSYVPKKDLRGRLCDAMSIVVSAVEASRYRERTRDLLELSEAVYILGYGLEEVPALVTHLQGNLHQINFCDEPGLFQVSTALAEALSNAMDHGNLELDSRLREEENGAYSKMRQERASTEPYSSRRVRLTERITPDEVTYVIRDEGNGFDIRLVPDPTKADNLLKASGRGLMLIRTFMDDVTHNDAGNEITMVKRRPTSDA